jgi:hypothetical protein
LFFQEPVQFAVAQLIQAAAGQHYSIHVWQIVLLQPETLSDVALDPVPLNGQAHVSLADDQTETRVLQGVGGCQNKKVAVRSLVLGVTEDTLKILAGKQTR